MNYSELLTSIKQTFIDQDSYLFDKHVPEFTKNGKFLGDYFNNIAVEMLGDKPPRFYHTFSPFDVISNKSPHHAVVFEAGEILLNIDFDNYVAMRTAAMTAVVLNSLNINDLKNKKVLLFGTGKIATQCVKILASEFGLDTLDIITKSGDLSRIKSMIEGVEIHSGSVDDIGQYDVIVCHTQAAAPVIAVEHIGKIKKGAVLASFISSTEHGEFPVEIYSSSRANIITDWNQTLLGAKDLKRAMDAHAFEETELIYVKDLLTGKNIDPEKQYTVYRSTGTPIQNLAVLRLLIP